VLVSISIRHQRLAPLKAILALSLIRRGLNYSSDSDRGRATCVSRRLTVHAAAATLRGLPGEGIKTMQRLAAATILSAVLVVSWVAEAAAKTVVLGEFSITLLTTITSVVATSTPIQCSVTASVSGSSATVFDSITEVGSVAATRSGSTATCHILMPYRWTLFDTGDIVRLSYAVTAVTGENGRSSESSFETIAVPANNATTTYVIDARI
jgi:hypothetical protein